jgi:hypothetical protein
MKPPELLIFATRYDLVTHRTHGIAQKLMANVKQLGIASVALFEALATPAGLVAAAANRPTVIAFYCHGDADGRLLAQDREPCWSSAGVPDLSGIVVFALACRAMCWLGKDAACLNARLLVGYECDLMTPANGSSRFWEVYEDIHCFVAQNLAVGANEAWIERQFYELCTKYVHELDDSEAGLVELIAIQQSRDEIQFQKSATGRVPLRHSRGCHWRLAGADAGTSFPPGDHK